VSFRISSFLDREVEFGDQTLEAGEAVLLQIMPHLPKSSSITSATRSIYCLYITVLMSQVPGLEQRHNIGQGLDAAFGFIPRARYSKGISTLACQTSFLCSH